MSSFRNIIIEMLFAAGIFLYFASCQKDNEVPDTTVYNRYSFFVAGHTYGKPGVDNAGLHPPFKKNFDLIKSDTLIKFGILTGDIVLNGTAKNWDEVDKDIKELGVPVYFAAGNHDMSNRVLFESRYGKTYFSFSGNNDLFIILDPNLDGWNISDEQLVFIKDELEKKAGDAKNIFVFFHQVLWWSPDNIFSDFQVNSLALRADTINFWSEVEPLFHSLPNSVYLFAGDVGAYDNGDEFMYYHYDNITFIASGMGGEARDNFVIVDVQPDKTVSFRLIALNGDNINALGRLEDYRLER